MSEAIAQPSEPATCDRCGKVLARGDKIWRYKNRIYHDACFQEVESPPGAFQGTAAGPGSALAAAPASSAPNAAPVRLATAGGSTFARGIVGALALLVGLVFLFDPGVDVATSGRFGLEETTRVVNMQRLAIGQTLTLAGAIFLGFAMRPR